VFLIYDQKFNSNELFIIASLTIGSMLVWKLPRRFTIKESLIYLSFFIFLGVVFDHTISIEPFDYYDVNDSSAYQFMDFLSYLSFGPFGYLYIYFYDYFKIKNKYVTIYIFVWTMSALAMEFIAQALGVYHYKNGYTIFYSFPIYLFILISHLCVYKWIHNKN